MSISPKKSITLPAGYLPNEDEEYMSSYQLEYFKLKLLKWRAELEDESLATVKHLQENNWKEPDLNDQASIETEANLELRTRDRYRKLINKIDDALERITQGAYGYCEDTGEPIGIKRLEARPIATLSIEAQQRHERLEKSHSED